MSLYIALTATPALLVGLPRGRSVPIKVPRISRAAHQFLLRPAIAALAFALGIYGAAVAAEGGQTKTVNDLTIRLDVTPAAAVKDPQPNHPDPRAHGNRSADRREYHVIVSLFDARTGARIENARIGGRVWSGGIVGLHDMLAPMKVADGVSYGAYFDVPIGPYSIEIDIEQPYGVVRVTFDGGR